MFRFLVILKSPLSRLSVGESMEFIKFANVVGISVLLLFVPFALVFDLSSCDESYEFDAFYLYDVPYFNQGSTYWCGPASMAMVLNYWGHNETMEDIASQIYDPQRRLTTIMDMAMYPQALGFYTESFVGSIDSIELYIQQGVPLIVLQRFSLQESYGHYRVVVGYSAKNSTVTTFDPIIGSDYEFSYEVFMELWKPGSTFSTSNWTLVVKPRNDVLINLMMDHQSFLNQGSNQTQRELDALRQKSSDLEIQINVFKVLAFIFLGVSVSLGVVVAHLARKSLRQRQVQPLNSGNEFV